MSKLAILGLGVMGETLLAGLLRAGWRADDIVGTERRDWRKDELIERYGIEIVSNFEAVDRSDVMVMVVKPQDVADLLIEVAPALQPGDLVVSLCAGVSIDLIEAHLPPGTPVVRVMPNTPAQVDEGMAAIAPGAHAGTQHVAQVESMMGAVGKAISVPERYLDAVTALSGSGPAYLFFVVEAMIEAGVHLGLPRDVSSELVVQTMLGSAKLLRDSGEHPALLRENVTSPGGTTAAAVRQLEEHRVRAAFIGAIEAAHDRSKALAEAARAATTAADPPSDKG